MLDCGFCGILLSTFVMSSFMTATALCWSLTIGLTPKWGGSHEPPSSAREASFLGVCDGRIGLWMAISKISSIFFQTQKCHSAICLPKLFVSQ
ncbi:MAG: hypothetical protein M2R45_00548 [Verrucomicrobia subdivision 3 bacterium]|nr:hypothetical protein [Limisphaerales bacterium]MCS1413574.1 hypothetical protein [Limisphaerales bacterium]